MRLIANGQMTGDYGTVVAGQEFTCADDIGIQLLQMGKARRPNPPTIQYETKVVTPEAPEVSARHPFRNVPVFDAQSKDMAAGSDPRLSTADLSTPGTDSSGRRGTRPRPDSNGR